MRNLSYILLCIIGIAASLVGNSQCNVTPQLTGNAIQNPPGNADDYIVVCTSGSPTGALIVQNGIGNNFLGAFNNYTIDWGDGSALYTTTDDQFTNPPATHEYAVGNYTLTFSASTSTCTVENEYEVYVGNTPSVSMGSPGGTQGCSEVIVSFPISNAGNNIPTTNYAVTFSDGSPTINFSQPPPTDVTHEFNDSSCGETFQNLNNSYGVTMVATNECGTAQVTVAPVTISDPPVADFTASLETICLGGTVTFDDTSDPGTTATSTSCDSNAEFYWTIAPATGWSISSGSTGSNNGLPNNFTVWTSGSDILGVNFLSPGTYTVNLNYRNGCGPSTKTETICVITPPTCDFDVNNNSGCGPLSVVTDNNTVAPQCGNTNINLNYNWAVTVPSGGSYNLTSGTLTSASPNFNFTNTTTSTLVYTLNLTVTPVNPQTGAAMTDCSTQCSETITVYPAPVINNHPTPTQTICVGGTPSQLSVSYLYGVGTPTYQWYSNTVNSNNGGTIINGATNSTYSPPTLTTAGNYYYYAVISLGGNCGTIVSNPACVSVVPDPTISTQPLTSQTICSGGNPGQISMAYTGGVGTPIYQWFSNNTNSTSNGTSIPGATSSSFTPSVPSTPGTYYFYGVVTLSGSGCNTATTNTSQVIVVSDPVVTIAPTTLTFCQNASSQQVTSVVTGGSGTNNYQWYQSTSGNNSGGTLLTGQTNATFSPPTNTVGTQYYYLEVTQSVSGCQAVSQVVQVNVLPSASINIQPIPSTVCIGGVPNILTANYIDGIGTPSYQWYSSANANGSNPIVISGATNANYTPPTTAAGTTYYYVSISFPSGGCANIQSTPVAVTVIADPTITIQPTTTIDVCAGGSVTSPFTSIVQGGTGALNYQWYSNTTSSNTTGQLINGATSDTYTPPVLNTVGSIYYYATITANGSGCGTSPSNVVSINVLNDPTITTQALSSQTVCQNTATSPLTLVVGGGVGTSAITWYSNGSNSTTGGTQVSTSASFTPPSTAVGTIYYYAVVNQSGSGCSVISAVSSVTVTPNPSISQQPVSSTVCVGGVATTLSVSFTNGLGTPTYQWFSSPNSNGSNPTQISGATSSTFDPPTSVAGSTYYFVTISFPNGACANLNSNPTLVTVVADPSISTQPISQQTICQGTALSSPISVTAQGGTGTISYQWYSNIAPNTTGGTLIPSATQPNYTPGVLNNPGNYYYYVTVSASGNDCQTSTSTIATLVVNPQATASVVGPFSSCGNSAVTITASSSGAGSWSAPAGSGTFNNSTSLQTEFTPSSSTAQNIVLTWTTTDPDGSGPCPVVSDTDILTIYPPATASINPVTSLCANSTLALAATSNSIGAWTTSGGGTFSSTTTLNTVYTPNSNDVANSPISFTWTTQDPDGAGPCQSVSAVQNVTVYAPPAVNAGADQTLCLNSPSINLSGTPSGGQWTGTPVTSTGSFNPTTVGTFVLTYSFSDSNGCSSQDQLTINVNEAATADANGPYSTCGIAPVNISATTNGNGIWTGGSGVFTNANNAVTTYTPASTEVGTQIILQWETVDPDGTGPCGNAIDNATLNINTPATAAPGGPYTICSSDVASIVVTTTPGNGSWTGGSGTFGSNTTATTTYDPANTEGGDAVILTWTTVDPDGAGPCLPVDADVTVNVLEAAIADANGPYATCGITPVNISATSNGNGIWTGGTGVFTNANNAATTYTPAVSEVGTVVVLTWETLDPDALGPCTNAIDNAQLTISTPATAAPGGPYTICSSDVANIVVTTTPGNGAWTGGSGTYGSNSNASTTYDPANSEGGSAVVLTWTTVDPDGAGPCLPVDADVTVNVLEAAIADANGPYATCGITPVNISATTNGNGIWTGGTGVFTNANNATTTYTPAIGEVGTVVVLTWETLDPDALGPCTNAIDNAQLTISTPATATPGGPYTICSSDVANIEVTTAPGDGTWVGGSGTFGNSTNAITTYDPASSEGGNTIVLTWTTVDPDGAGPCLPVDADVTVNVLEAAIADANGPYATCGITPINITATTNGNGIWTGGTGVFGNANNATTNYTPAANEVGTVVVLTWETLDPDALGPCTNAIDDAELTISTPATAAPGGPYTICSSDVANIEVTTAPGDGTWVGGSGTFGNSTNAITTYDPASSEGGNTIVLTWTTVDPDGAGPCLPVDADVTVNVLEAAIADANGPYATCGITPINITATTNGNGIWTGGTGVFTNANNAATTYTPAISEVGTVVVLTWETLDPDDLGPCSNAIDDAELTISTPATAIPGGPYTICSSDVANIEVTTAPGDGTWIGGSGTFGNSTNAITTYDPASSEAASAVVLTWTTVDPDGAGPCLPIDADVTVNVLEAASATISGPYLVCSNSEVEIQAISNGAGEWTINPIGSGILEDNQSFETTFTPTTDLFTSSDVTLTWTTFDPDGAGPCTAFIIDDIIQITSLPVIDLEPNFAIDCGDEISAEVSGGAGNYSYSWSPTLGLVTPNLSVTPVNASGTYILTATDENQCSNSDSTTVLINALDQMAFADDVETCIFDAVDIVGEATLGQVPFTYQWTPSTFLSPGTINSSTTTFLFSNYILNDTIISVNLFVTDALGCSDNESVDVTIHPLPIVNAGADIIICQYETPFTISNYSPLEVTGLSGIWTPSIDVDPAQLSIGDNVYNYSFTDLNSCTNEDELIVFIEEVPQSNFIYPASACEGSQVEFTNTTQCGSCDQLTFEWLIGVDLYESSATNLEYTFQDTGYFDVRLISSSESGCLDTIIQTIHILALPETDFSVNVNTGCGPLPVSILNTSVGASLTYSWNVDPFGPNTNFEPGNITFPSAPCDSIFYNVSLSATNLCGTVQVTDSVLVYSLPQPQFSLATDSICSENPLDIFNNTICAWETEYYWYFGDGNESDSQELLLNQTYFVEGNFANYPITLSATNTCGTVDVTQIITVVPNEINAFFNADPIVGCEPLLVNFDQEMSGVTYFSWNFGDQITSAIEDPSHLYNSDGLYTAMYVAGNFCGAQDTAYQVIEVLPAPDINFSSSQQYLCIGESTTFSPYGDPISAYSWTFGDGGESNSISPSYIYETEGEQEVTLTVISAINGCPNSVTNTVEVITTPVAQITIDDAEGCPPFAVTFSNNTINAINYFWNLGDGNYYIGDTLVHTFGTSGVYNVEIIAINDNSCTDTTQVEITVYPTPEAAFGFQTFDDDYYYGVAFENYSMNAIGYEWSFGDNGLSYATNPYYSYTKAGDCFYYPELVAFNTFGCTDTARSEIAIPFKLDIFIPNSFTPNEDGLNDIFTVVTTDVDPYNSHLSIIDRWGVIVHESTGNDPGWNGYIEGEPAPNDVYQYIYKGRKKCDYEEFQKVGHLTLVR